MSIEEMNKIRLELGKLKDKSSLKDRFYYIFDIIKIEDLLANSGYEDISDINFFDNIWFTGGSLLMSIFQKCTLSDILPTLFLYSKEIVEFSDYVGLDLYEINDNTRYTNAGKSDNNIYSFLSKMNPNYVGRYKSIQDDITVLPSTIENRKYYGNITYLNTVDKAFLTFRNNGTIQEDLTKVHEFGHLVYKEELRNRMGYRIEKPWLVEVYAKLIEYLFCDDLLKNGQKEMCNYLYVEFLKMVFCASKINDLFDGDIRSANKLKNPIYFSKKCNDIGLSDYLFYELVNDFINYIITFYFFSMNDSLDSKSQKALDFTLSCEQFGLRRNLRRLRLDKNMSKIVQKNYDKYYLSFGFLRKFI